ncbi:MAG: DUF2628 domain-containing protein [Oscillospiraceae bacterium]|nr:DUF2628 domain-containing protein [Oscillospiraceae bacterium]
MNYIGYDCPVCHKTFADGDDVVVCPVCGAPHHRECYKQQGGCGLEENHAKGIAWEDHINAHNTAYNAPNREQYNNGGFGGGESYHSSTTDNNAVQRCPSCGSVNPSDGIFCQVCGTMLGRNSYNSRAYGPGAAGPYANNQNPQQQYQNMYSGPFYSPYGGMNPEETLGEATVKEVATYVGPSSHYYLSRFRLMKANKRSSSFCWSGFLFGFLYFFYRKMYRVGIPLLIIFLFSMIPSFVYSYEYLRELSIQYASLTFPLPVIETTTLQNLAYISNIAQMANFGVSMVVGFTGHKLYLQDINRKISAIKARVQTANTDEYISTLSREGGVSPVLPAVLVGLLLFAYIGASMAIAMILNLNI